MGHFHWRRFPLPFLLLLLAVAPAFAVWSGRLTGTVTDEDGRPMPGVAITVTGSGTVGRRSATTDDEGVYMVLGLPLREELVVRADAPGKVSMVYRGVLARENYGTRRDFRLRPPGLHEILVIAAPGHEAYGEARAGLDDTIAGRVVTLDLTGRNLHDARALHRSLEDLPNAVIAIGRDAAHLARENIRTVPVVYLMVPDPLGVDMVATNICGVALNGGYESTLERFARFDPAAHRLVTFYDPHRLARAVTDLQQAAAGMGMRLDAVSVDTPSALLSAVSALRPGAYDALFLMMDPGLLDMETLGELGERLATKRLSYIVPDPSLMKRGGTFMFAPGFREMGAEAGRLANSIVADGLVPSQMGLVFPAARNFAVDETRARELGLETSVPGR